MLTTKELINIFLPVIRHWLIWLIFLIIVIIVSFLYIYSYKKKTWKEFRIAHISILITNILSLYLFTKMLEEVIYQGSILKVDNWISEINFNNYIPWITSFAKFITNFGSTLVVSILFIIALTVLLLRKRWRFALLSTVAIVGALILQVVIKLLVHRSRPLAAAETMTLQALSTSFPSGHAIMAIVFVSLLIYSFKDDFKHMTVKYTLIIASSSFFVAVSISRIILHVHWFSDVLAGMSLGLFWFMFVVLIERSITGLIQSIRTETKEAKPIKVAEVVKVAKKIVEKK